MWALADIEQAWRGPAASSNLKEVVLEAMLAQPVHWARYYADAASRRLDMQYSLSDRIRYYWNQPRVRQACADMLAHLGDGPLPLTLLSQFMPLQYAAVRAGRLANNAPAVLQEAVAAVLRHYVAAVDPDLPRTARAADGCGVAQ